MVLQFLKVLIVSKLNLVTKIYHIFQILFIVTTVVYRKLYATVEVYRKH